MPFFKILWKKDCWESSKKPVTVQLLKNFIDDIFKEVRSNRNLNPSRRNAALMNVNILSIFTLYI